MPAIKPNAQMAKHISEIMHMEILTAMEKKIRQYFIRLKVFEVTTLGWNFLR